jgi:hypothetical protein
MDTEEVRLGVPWSCAVTTSPSLPPRADDKRSSLKGFTIRIDPVVELMEKCLSRASGRGKMAYDTKLLGVSGAS